HRQRDRETVRPRAGPGLAVAADGHRPAPPPAACRPAVHLSSGPEDWLRLLAERHGAERIAHVERLPERAGSPAAWPSWVDPQVYAALAGAGIRTLWSHQRQGMDLA